MRIPHYRSTTLPTSTTQPRSFFHSPHNQRPHSALSDSTPADAYEKGMMLEVQAEAHRSPAPLPAQPEQETVLNRTLAA